MRLAYKWQAALISALGLFMAVLDNTVVNVSLPQMANSFHTDAQTMEWVVTAYFLAQAAVIPVTGYLSDLIGTKTVFIAALALFTVGSAICAFAPTKELLFAFRVLQGVGGGALFPIVFAIIFRAFPPDERGPAGAVVGVPVLLAPAFGPTIGGYLTTTFDWNAIFTVNVPIGILALVGASLILRGRKAEQAALGTGPGRPESPEAARKRFDVLGLVLAMSGFTSLVYGISQAGQPTPDGTGVVGWTAPSAVGWLIAGAVLLAIFVVAELRASDPVIDLRLFKSYVFTSSNLLMYAINAFFFGSILLMPLFFENVRGLTALSTGEIFILQGIASAVATAFSGRLYNRVGPRVLAALGFALVTVGTWGLTQVNVNTNGSDIQLWLILRGLGLGMTNIPLQTLALSVVNNRAMARASSLVSAMRQVAGAIGVTLLITYVTQQTTSHVAAARSAFQTGPLTEAAKQCVAQLHQLPSSPAVQACVGKFTQAHAQTYVFGHAFTSGFVDTFWIVTIATGVCTVLALFVGNDPNVVALKKAAARGEVVQARPAVIGE